MGNMVGANILLRNQVDLSFTCARFRFVKADGSGYAGPSDSTAGVSEFTGASGDTLDTAIEGIAIVEAGGIVAAGDDVISDSNGKAVAASPLEVKTGATAVTSSGANGTILQGTSLPTFKRGRALTAGSSGDFIRVLLAV